MHLPETELAPDSILQQRKMRHLLVAATPSGDIDVDALTRELRVALIELWKDELQVRKQLLRSRHEQRLKFGLTEPGQIRAEAFHETPAASHPALRDHRHSSGAEGFHVAVDGALGDFEARRELAAGDAAVKLKLQKDRE